MIQMETEDHVCQIYYKSEELKELREENEETRKEMQELSEK